jgi:hypothetical protein
MPSSFNLGQPFTASQKEHADAIGAAASRLGVAILNHTKQSREQSLAMTKLEEAAMWAKRAIEMAGP